MDADLPEEASTIEETLLISSEGVASYLTCRRTWWLADVLGHAPGEELQQAQAALARRQQISQWLFTAGGLLIALAILLVTAGLLVG